MIQNCCFLNTPCYGIKKAYLSKGSIKGTSKDKDSDVDSTIYQEVGFLHELN